jgi:catechol-2,3-dioxygenase
VNATVNTADASVTGAKAVPSPAKFAHVVLRTSRFHEMLDWYRLVLNATTTFADENIGFVTYDEEHHRVAFVHIPGLADQPDGVAGVHHYAFTYATLGDLLTTHKRLEAAGVMPIVTINHGPTVSFYYEDPDRNQVELQVDAYETIEESAKFFHTEQFAINPIGVDVDPEDLIVGPA